jgi:hypothetical protein
VLGTAELTLIGPGTSLVVGTVDAGGAPRATRAWAASPVGHDRVRVLVSADDPVVVDSLQHGGAIAVTGADVRSLRAVQLKGTLDLVEPPTAHDLAALEAHVELFFDEVHATDGNPIELLRRLLPHRVVAVELVVDEVFDQSPGPAAGAALAPRGGHAR